MKSIKNLDQNTQDWMETLGNFGVTNTGDEVKGYMEGGKVYFSATDLRELAKACSTVANYLEETL